MPLPLSPTRQAALADLNTKLAEPLPMNRFRPNIEVGSPRFEYLSGD